VRGRERGREKEINKDDLIYHWEYNLYQTTVMFAYWISNYTSLYSIYCIYLKYLCALVYQVP